MKLFESRRTKFLRAFFLLFPALLLVLSCTLFVAGVSSTSDQAVHKEQDALEQALKNRIPEFGQIPSLSALSEITFSDLGKAATFRDPTALAMVKEMAWELSIALSNLISTVNPSLIVLGGKIPALGEYFLNEVREDLKKTGFRRMVDNVTVRYSQLQSDSFLNGAMKYFFDIHYSFTNQDLTNFFIG